MPTGGGEKEDVKAKRKNKAELRMHDIRQSGRERGEVQNKTGGDRQSKEIEVHTVDVQMYQKNCSEVVNLIYCYCTVAAVNLLMSTVTEDQLNHNMNNRTTDMN